MNQRHVTFIAMVVVVVGGGGDYHAMMMEQRHTDPTPSQRLHIMMLTYLSGGLSNA